MNAVGTSDHGRHLVLEGAPLERRQHLVDIGDEQVGGAHQLHIQASVKHVGRRHALVNEARLRSDDFGEVGEERDNVMLDLAFNLVDAAISKVASLPLAQITLAASFGTMPLSARASVAWASIWNQIRKRVWGSQIAAISGRV